MSEETQQSIVVVLGIVIAIGMIVVGAAQCGARDTEVYKACLSAGHKPAECSQMRGPGR